MASGDTPTPVTREGRDRNAEGLERMYEALSKAEQIRQRMLRDEFTIKMPSHTGITAGAAPRGMDQGALASYFANLRLGELPFGLKLPGTKVSVNPTDAQIAQMRKSRRDFIDRGVYAATHPAPVPLDPLAAAMANIGTGANIGGTLLDPTIGLRLTPPRAPGVPRPGNTAAMAAQFTGASAPSQGPVPTDLGRFHAAARAQTASYQQQRPQQTAGGAAPNLMPQDRAPGPGEGRAPPKTPSPPGGRAATVKTPDSDATVAMTPGSGGGAVPRSRGGAAPVGPGNAERVRKERMAQQSEHLQRMRESYAVPASAGPAPGDAADRKPFPARCRLRGAVKPVRY